MTICISAICEAGAATINIGDEQVGVGFTAGELGRTKWDDLCSGWVAGFAGALNNANEVIELARLYAREIDSSADVSEVRHLLEKSYKAARMSRVEAEFLAPRGWTLEEFKDHGRAKLPEATYANIDARISLFDFNADLIVSGWGKGDTYAAVLTIKNPGVCQDHSRLGFWCIGSGATAAQMSLFSRNYSPDMSVEEAAYYAVEAKIAAEKASGVGGRIDAFLEWKDSDSEAFAEGDGDILRSIYNDLKQRDLSAESKNRIGEIARIKLFKAQRNKS
jgi:hypothetical protein